MHTPLRTGYGILSGFTSPRGSPEAQTRVRPSGCAPYRAGYTISEMLVVTLIVLFLAGISVAVYRRAKEHSLVTDCMGNLRTVSQVTEMYFNNYSHLPSDLQPMHAVLESFGLAPKSMICPADKRLETRDSYSRCYVRRGRGDPDHSVLTCCGRHPPGKGAAVLVLAGRAQVRENVSVEYTVAGGSSRELVPGDSFREGTLRAPDGADLTVSNVSSYAAAVDATVKPNHLLLISSYRTDEIYRLVVFIPPAILGEFQAQASPGTYVEVVSAFIVMTVASGSGTLMITDNGADMETTVYADAGKVCARRRDIERAADLLEATSMSVTKPFP